MTFGRLRLYLGVLRAEGLRAAADRLADRLDERRRRRSFHEVAWGAPAGGAAPVLNVLPTPPLVSLGGMQTQFRRRWDVERGLRPGALLYPWAGAYRLERWESERRLAMRAGSRAVLPPLALTQPAFEDALKRGVELTGAPIVHVENAAGLPIGSLRACAEARTLVLSVHDFAPFCPRPLLIERPAGRFCGYARDPERCTRCLRADWPVEDGYVERLRSESAGLLRAAAAVVYPSEFMRRALGELFEGLDPARQHVIEPAGVSQASGQRAATEAARRPRRAAFVGGARLEKGAMAFAEVVRRSRAAGLGLDFAAYGGGDRQVLSTLRGLGVDVRGYYRSGSLARRLIADGVDVALVLSIGPESFGLAVDECRAAGVPVVTFAHGAPGERVREEGGGWAVPLGVEPVVDLLREWPGPPPPLRTVPKADGTTAARRHVELYERLRAR